MSDWHGGQVSHFCHFFPRLWIHSAVYTIIVDHNDDHRQIIPGKKLQCEIKLYWELKCICYVSKWRKLTCTLFLLPCQKIQRRCLLRHRQSCGLYSCSSPQQLLLLQNQGLLPLFQTCQHPTCTSAVLPNHTLLKHTSGTSRLKIGHSASMYYSYGENLFCCVLLPCLCRGR